MSEKNEFNEKEKQLRTKRIHFIVKNHHVIQ